MSRPLIIVHTHPRLQALHVDDVVGVLRAEALLASGDTAKNMGAAADTLMSVHQSLRARLRDTTAKVGMGEGEGWEVRHAGRHDAN